MDQCTPKAELHTRFPVWSVVLYNGSTIFHFLLGGIGIVIGYGFSPFWAWFGSILYMVFAFGELYILMPRAVCPSCVYYRLEDSRCISALNLLAKKVAKPLDSSDFSKRAEGILCCNNLYIAALLFPIIAVVPALIVEFSINLLIVLSLLIASLLFRFLVLFPKVGCLHCRAKHKCPQAGAMGVREL